MWKRTGGGNSDFLLLRARNEIENWIHVNLFSSSEWGRNQEEGESSKLDFINSTSSAPIFASLFTKLFVLLLARKMAWPIYQTGCGQVFNSFAAEKRTCGTIFARWQSDNWSFIFPLPPFLRSPFDSLPISAYKTPKPNDANISAFLSSSLVPAPWWTSLPAYPNEWIEREKDDVFPQVCATMDACCISGYADISVRYILPSADPVRAENSPWFSSAGFDQVIWLVAVC